jgi:hypothetical protein
MTEWSKPPRPEARQFQADLLRAAKTEQPRKRSIERTFAVAALIAVESCEVTIARPPSFHGDLLRRLALPMAGILATSAIALGVLRGEAPAPAPAPAPALAPAPTEPAPIAPAPIAIASAPLVAVVPRPAVLPSADVPLPVAAVCALREAQPPVAAPRAEAPPQKLRPVAVAPTPAADPGEDEITMLRRAKSQLSASDPRGALATLDAHDRVFPHGVLVEEAEALRVSALATAGDAARARAAGARFLAAHPESPYAQRVRTVMAGAPSSE